MPIIRKGQNFYRPQYASSEVSLSMNDIRSTIHWDPQIVTHSDGKAHVSFYAGDFTGTYTVTIEGCDVNGQLGSLREKIRVEK